jgi:3-phenylpropionate/trans-cinnamate dioxygenase ferredoxin component
MAYERVAGADELARGSALRVELGGEPICVVRLRDGACKAVHDTCSHQEYSLAEGWVDGNGIECALHGSVFDLDTGRPTSLPAVTPIPVYDCKVDDDGIWVDVDAQLNDAPIPEH